MDVLSYALTPPPRNYSQPHGGAIPQWIVNGIPLRDRLGALALELVCPLVWPNADEAAARLLLRAPSDLVTGRRCIFVCQVCGDPGCGVISARVERDGDVIVWSEFAEESGLRDDLCSALEALSLDEYAGVGPFRFDFNVYRATLLELARLAHGGGMLTGE